MRAEIGDAVAGAERKKIGARPEVVFLGEADGFVESLGGFNGRRYG